MNVQPLSAEANLEEYGSDISQKYKAIIERSKYEGKFKENDLVYLDGASPEGETKYGENANYKMFPPRIQNKCILIHFKRINTKQEKIRAIIWNIDFSEKGLDELLNKINKSTESIKEACYETIEEISEEKVNEINQNKYHMQKKETVMNEEKVSGGFQSTTKQDIYQEFGTGIIGQQKSHPKSSGYKTSHNIKRHNIATGEIQNIETDYWVYYKDGTFHSTKGQPAKKKIWEAKEEIESNFTKRISNKIRKKLKG